MNTITEIPQGTTREEVKIRKKYIIDFYVKWNTANPEKQIYNNDLQEFIKRLSQKSKHRVIPAKAGISCQSLIVNNQQFSINDL